MSYSTVPKLIRLYLASDPVIAAKVGSRIHYQTVPQESVYPHIYYSRTGKDNDTLLDGSSGRTTERFTLELVAQAFDEELCDAVESVLQTIETTYEDVTVDCTDVEDVDDNYAFKSADSDALFMHGFTVAVYCQ